jgi:hypothetical protein
MSITLRNVSFAAVVVGAGVWSPRVPADEAGPDFARAMASVAAAPHAAAPRAAAVARQEPCDGENVKNSHSQISDDDGDRRTTIRWSAGDCQLELRARGRFVVKGDLSDFESVARGGWLKLTEERGRSERELEIRNDDGRMARTYKVNGADHPFDDEARRWLAGVLLELERRTAFAADQRVPRLLASGGPEAVIDEVARLRGDYAAHVYFSKLFEHVPRLEAPLVRRVLTVAGQRISSDYYRTEVLKSVERRGLPDDASRLAFVTAASTIGSDYYRSEALKLLLDEDDRLTRPVGDALLRASAGMSSDYYASETLKRAAKRGLVRTDNRDAFFKATREVDSDYYRAEILLSLLRGDEVDKTLVRDVVAATEGMSSDHYVTEVLLAAAKRYAIEGETRDAYIRAAKALKSDHYHRQAMSALVKQSMVQ